MIFASAGLSALKAAHPSAAEGASDEHVIYLPLAANVPQSGVIQGFLDQGGMRREYILYVPTSYTGRDPAPLILNYHAYSRDAIIQMVYGDFRPVAEQTGAIIVHPQGAMLDGVRRWNVGGYYTHPTADDLGFTDALLDAVSGTYNVDASRIYATGFSNGATMAYLVACQLDQRFAAVAAVSGSMTPEMLAGCHPSRPLPVLHIHGLADAVVPYGGDSQSIAVEELIAFWVDANHSNPEGVVRQRPDIDPSDGSTVTEVSYEGGPNGVTTELLRIDGGGHAWPGTAVAGPGTNYDIDASAEIWDFFARYDINGRRAISNQQPMTND
jgi:polyhydroxybutyrate depolymerase